MVRLCIDGPSKHSQTNCAELCEDALNGWTTALAEDGSSPLDLARQAGCAAPLQALLAGASPRSQGLSPRDKLAASQAGASRGVALAPDSNTSGSYLGDAEDASESDQTSTPPDATRTLPGVKLRQEPEQSEMMRASVSPAASPTAVSKKAAQEAFSRRQARAAAHSEVSAAFDELAVDEPAGKSAAGAIEGPYGGKKEDAVSSKPELMRSPMTTMPSNALLAFRSASLERKYARWYNAGQVRLV